MKRIVLIFMLFTFANSAYAQFNDNDGIYSSFELNMGNYLGVDINLNYAIDQKYSLKLGYNFQIRSAVSKPEDFSSGLGSIFTFGLGNPTDRISSYQLGVGRIFDFTNNQTFRLNFSIGVTYSNVIEPTNWNEVYDNSYWDYNYEWDTEVSPTISLIINPKFEFIPINFIGFTISPMIIINKYTSYYGIGFGGMLGSIIKKKY